MLICRRQRVATGRTAQAAGPAAGSMSSKSKSMGVIGAPFSKGQVSKKPALEGQVLLGILGTFRCLRGYCLVNSVSPPYLAKACML